jgi:Fic family protein
MMTLKQLSKGLDSVPTTISWYLADIGEAKGKQALFAKQSPQRLKALREHALIESAVSSNRIEGVEIDRKRIGTIIFGKQPPRDRSEEEVRGYQEALNLIHEEKSRLSITEKTIRDLHRLTRNDAWDGGKYKEKNSDIVEKHADGRSSIRFRTIPADNAPAFMKELIEMWRDCAKEKWVHPIIAAAAFNLDFLCIHPFRDGNGRVSRLLLLLQCYHAGLDVGRYISLERVIEENKERYYETLAASSKSWHEGNHDPWPYIGFVCYIIKSAYKEFEERLGNLKGPRGEKTTMIMQAIEKSQGQFSVGDVAARLPGISIDMIRKIFKDLQANGDVECLGRGRNAMWHRTRKTRK